MTNLCPDLGIRKGRSSSLVQTAIDVVDTDVLMEKGETELRSGAPSSVPSPVRDRNMYRHVYRTPELRVEKTGYVPGTKFTV